MTTIDEKEILEIEKIKIEIKKITLETRIIPYDVILKVGALFVAGLSAGKWLL